MKIQFDSRNGAMAASNDYAVNAIPWRDGSFSYYMWNITIRNVEDEDKVNNLTSIELYCQDIPILKLEKVFEWLTENSEKSADEIKQYIRENLSRRKCNVYKVTGEGSSMKIVEKSKGAKAPVLQYPGTRLDEISD